MMREECIDKPCIGQRVGILRDGALQTFLYEARCVFVLFAAMDPYLDAPESHSIPDEELDDDTLLQLEQDLAPKASDYYGVLNVSRTVRSCFFWRTITAIHTTQCSRVNVRQQKTKSRTLTRNYAASSILTR